VAINGFHRLSADPADDLDVPDFMKPPGAPEAAPLTLVGEVIPQPDGGEDDIAPGVIEYRPVRTPVLYRGASAAMTVASVTGRVIGLSARAAWTVTAPARTAASWFGHGAWSAGYLGYRYVRGHDFEEAIGGVSKKADWNKREDLRRKRWWTLGISAGATVAADLAAWWALVKYAGMTALDWSWAVMPGIEALAAGALLTLYGKYRLENQLTPGQIAAPEDIDDGEEPFPLAWCTDGKQVIECIGRALAYEGIDTRRVDILGNRNWGWEIDIDLKGSTPGKVNAAADQLEAHMNLPSGGCLIEPDPANRAHIVLRLVTSDPFANMPRPAVHPPNSLSVKDVVVRGRSMDGEPLELRLRGMSMLIIGKSGSAKTKGALRCIVEAITSCRDAIAIEMDPVKGGLREFEGVMAAPPIRGGADCTEWLQRLVKIASARNDVKHHLNMGDLWEPSPQHPAVYAIVDEFIYLPKEAKALAIELLRIGRETGVFLIFAAQEGTEDSLGDAIADSVTYRVMLASRAEDIRLVLGTGAAAAGYRPDRLQPAVDDERVYDAGKCYIRGPGYDRPILWKWDRIERDQIMQAVADRKTAGRPWFDHDSLAAADLLHLAAEFGPDAGAGGALSVADRLEALAVRGGSRDAATVAALLRLFDQHGKTFLPTAVIVDAGIAGDGAELQALLVRLVPMAKSAKEYVDGKQVRGWERVVADKAAAALFAPS
jgi:S-DNA-T family DNA segregation ATPase FtsK/SpoIIIE